MNWYALFIGLGASLGILQVVNSAPPGQIHRYVDAALFTLFAAGLGARLAYVGLHGSYYMNHNLEAFQLQQGGLSAPGALAGGLLAALCLAKLLQVPFSKLADGLSPMLTPLCIAAWLGCWSAGCAYGLPAAPGAWLSFNTIDETGVMIPRIPLQFITALCLMEILWRIELRKKPFKGAGQKASLMGLGITGTYLAATFLMGDPAPRWSGLRPESWMAIFLCLVNLTACAAAFRLFPTKTRGAP